MQYLEPTVEEINLEGLESMLRSLKNADVQVYYYTIVFVLGQIVIFFVICLIIKLKVEKVNFFLKFLDEEI